MLALHEEGVNDYLLKNCQVSGLSCHCVLFVNFYFLTRKTELFHNIVIFWNTGFLDFHDLQAIKTNETYILWLETENKCMHDIKLNVT